MGYNTENIIKQFKKADLTLEIAKEPFARGLNAEDIFGLDIRRKKANDARTEFFLMWPGHEENTIIVKDINDEFGQVILGIQEDEREFERPIDQYTVKRALERNKNPDDALKSIMPPGRMGYPKVKIWRPAKKELVIVERTPKESRTFLLGMDERQLFMTQVSRNINTVVAAHASLKTPTVTFFEGKADGKTIRQGEWFFVNITSDEQKAIDDALKKNLIGIKSKEPIGNHAGRRGGKPHTADELIIMAPSSNRVRHVVLPSIVNAHIYGRKDKEVGLEEMLKFNNLTRADVIEWNPNSLTLVVWLKSPRANSRTEIFVRGSVKHLDHATVKFSNWRKVIGNTEVRTSNAVGGGTWID